MCASSIKLLYDCYNNQHFNLRHMKNREEQKHYCVEENLKTQQSVMKLWLIS